MSSDRAALRANPIGFQTGVGPGALVLAYPLIVYLGLTRLGTRYLGLMLLGFVAMRLAFGLRASAAGHLGALAGQLMPVAAIVVLAVVLDDSRFILALPVLINLALLAVFARSLWQPMPIVERIARIRDPDLIPAEVDYCAGVTRMWCGFFAANAAVVACLAVAAPLSWWTLYTGLLSYALIGLLMAGEFAVRRYRFRRFGDGPIDHILAAWFERSSADSHASGASPRSLDWTQIAEKGSVLGVRCVLFLSVWLGRPAVRVLMNLVAAYYLVRDSELRRVSRDFHERVGLVPSLANVFRHIRCFAYCAADRIFLLRGDTRLFRITRHGREHLEQAVRAGRGGILIGAHVGSFEALRAAAGDDGLPISVVAYFRNAAMYNAVLEGLDPELAARIIHIDPGKIGYMLEIRRRVEAGELVAFLGDRYTPGAETVEVDFLGENARFPTGVFAVASALGCPVLLVHVIYRDPNVYDVYCEPFADRVTLARRGGLEEKRRLVQRYAGRLEHYVRRAPSNWFNFYDFWEHR